MTPSTTRRLGGGEGVSAAPTSPNIRPRPSNMTHSTSSQSLLSLAKDVMGSSLANEMESSAAGSIRSLNLQGSNRNLQKQPSSSTVISFDSDAASYSDFSQGRCYNDVAGKTNVLLRDDEMWKKFKSSLGKNGVTTGVGVKMALQQFVSENITDEDVARSEAEAAAASKATGKEETKKMSSLGLGNLLGLKSNSAGFLVEGAQSFGNLQAETHDLNESWENQSISSLSAPAMRRVNSINNLIGSVLGRGVNSASSSLPLPAVILGDTSDHLQQQQRQSLNTCNLHDQSYLVPNHRPMRKRSGSETSASSVMSTLSMGSSRNHHAQECQNGNEASLTDATGTGTMELEQGIVDDDDSMGDFRNMPPRAAERKRRTSFGSLGALPMTKEFIIDELSDEDDDSSLSGDEEEDVPVVGGDNKQKQQHEEGDDRECPSGEGTDLYVDFAHRRASADFAPRSVDINR